MLGGERDGFQKTIHHEQENRLSAGPAATGADEFVFEVREIAVIKLVLGEMCVEVDGLDGTAGAHLLVIGSAVTAQVAGIIRLPIVVIVDAVGAGRRGHRRGLVIVASARAARIVRIVLFAVLIVIDGVVAGRGLGQINFTGIPGTGAPWVVGEIDEPVVIVIETVGARCFLRAPSLRRIFAVGAVAIERVDVAIVIIIDAVVTLGARGYIGLIPVIGIFTPWILGVIDEAVIVVVDPVIADGSRSQIDGLGHAAIAGVSHLRESITAVCNGSGIADRGIDENGLGRLRRTGVANHGRRRTAGALVYVLGAPEKTQGGEQ